MNHLYVKKWKVYNNTIAHGIWDLDIAHGIRDLGSATRYCHLEFERDNSSSTDEQL